jgi:peroxiredoxin
MMVAGFVVWHGPTDPGLSPLIVVGWFGALSVSERIAFLGAVFGLAYSGGTLWLLVQIVRQQGRLLLRVDALEAQLAGLIGVPASGPAAGSIPAYAGLPMESVAPTFQLPDLDGGILTLGALCGIGKPVVLIFVDPGCGPCSALLPDLGRWQREHAGQLTVAVISRGTADENRALCTEHGLTRVLLQHDREVAEAYQAYATPSAVLIRPDGTVGSPLAQGPDECRALVCDVLNRPKFSTLPMLDGTSGHELASAPAFVPLKLGEPAPPIQLPDLGGRRVSLAEFRGTKTVVVFWNPDCGFCQQMLPDLRNWEGNPPKGAPKLLVVSTGSVEANRAQGLKSPVVLDQAFAVGSAFGAMGTPSAVLVDAKGTIASDVVLGASAVLMLAREEPTTTLSQER